MEKQLQVEVSLNDITEENIDDEHYYDNYKQQDYSDEKLDSQMHINNSEQNNDQDI